MTKTCEHCDSAPATTNLCSFDVDKLCDPCRFKDAQRRAMRRESRKPRKSNFYYPCS